jgi:molybdate transport system permease protein
VNGQAKRQATRRAPAPLLWLAGLLAIYLIAPLVAGAEQAGLADWNSVDGGALLRATVVSVASASLATLLIAIGGIPLGYLLARAPGRAVAAVGFLVQLPLALPPLASGILLLFLVGYSAPLGRLTNGALTDSFAGIVLAEVFVAAPFLIIAARSAFAAMDPVLEGVAATLGRRPLAVFFRVCLPIARPAILSGLLLAWLRAFGEFGATVMVAYHPYSLPVYTYVAFGAQGLPAMLPVLLPTLAAALAIMALSGVIARQTAGRFIKPAAAATWPHRQPPVGTGLHQRTGAINLALKLEKQLNGFRLDLAWSPHGRRLAVLGPSGSGKSLLLKLIAGIERADRGTIMLDRRDLSSLEPAVRGIAYVPQNYGLFPHLTVAAQLQFPAGADPALAARWLDRLRLRGLEQRHPAELSLGQQQRVALARALVRPARLLLLDEPFSALDAPLRADLRREMRALQDEIDAATILVTHDPAEAALLADQLLLLDDGRVLQAGPTADVFRRPANETAARLLGAETVAKGVATKPDGIAVGAGIVLTVAGPPLATGTHVGWTVPATQVRLSDAGQYPGRIEDDIVVGMERQLAIRVGDALIGALSSNADHAPGSACRVDIDPAAVRIWPLAESPNRTSR